MGLIYPLPKALRALHDATICNANPTTIRLTPDQWPILDWMRHRRSLTRLANEHDNRLFERNVSRYLGLARNRVNVAVATAGGGWQLLSDHSARELVAFPEDAAILGRVVWTARALL